MRWARTGCRVDNSARLIKLASRSFSFRNLVFRILTRRICDHGGPMQPHKKLATDYTDKKGIYLRDLWLKFVRSLTLNDLHARIELNIKLARVDLLILFQTGQTHRR